MGDLVSDQQPVGGTKWQIQFYEDILKRSPNYVEVLMVLGGLYTRKKMYSRGLEVDERLATLKKGAPIVHYNLACSYALLDEVHKAFEALTRAIDLGYRDVDHMDQDEDLDNIRSDPRYAETVNRIRCSLGSLGAES